MNCPTKTEKYCQRTLTWLFCAFGEKFDLSGKLSTNLKTFETTSELFVTPIELTENIKQKPRSSAAKAQNIIFEIIFAIFSRFDNVRFALLQFICRLLAIFGLR